MDEHPTLASVSPIQAAFSNGAIYDHDAPWATTGLRVIAEAVAASHGNFPDDDGSVETLTGNTGMQPYENATFTMRAYCWCDGEQPGHADGCPPNFEHKPSGLQVSWYKHAGRGVTANQPRPEHWTAIIAECLDSVGSNTDTPPVTCIACHTTLEPVFHDTTAYQFDNAMWIGIFGGYGMFTDNLLDREASPLPGPPDLTAVLCHDCAHALCDTVPWLGALVDPQSSHAHSYNHDWTGHTGWDLPHAASDGPA